MNPNHVLSLRSCVVSAALLQFCANPLIMTECRHSGSQSMTLMVMTTATEWRSRIKKIKPLVNIVLTGIKDTQTQTPKELGFRPKGGATDTVRDEAVIKFIQPTSSTPGILAWLLSIVVLRLFFFIFCFVYSRYLFPLPAISPERPVERMLAGSHRFDSISNHPRNHGLWCCFFSFCCELSAIEPSRRNPST